MSGQETWFVVSVSGGSTSADPEAPNCAASTNSCRLPANGVGNVSRSALGTEGKYCAVSSPFAGPSVDLLTLSGGTMAITPLSVAFSALLVCLCLYAAVLPKESFFTFVPLGIGDEGDKSFEAPACRVLASSPASYTYGWPDSTAPAPRLCTAGCDGGIRSASTESVAIASE